MFSELMAAGGLGSIEHPAEPWWAPGCSSIWRTGFVSWLARSPAVQIVRIKQSTHGQKSAKPTFIAALRLPSLQKRLNTRQTLPDALSDPSTSEGHTTMTGRNAAGEWHTSSLTIYPPSMCRGMALAMTESMSTWHHCRAYWTCYFSVCHCYCCCGHCYGYGCETKQKWS